MPTPPPTRAEQAQARREHIIDAALRLFAKQGFAATTTKQIAQEAGIREGLLHHYFPSKAGLLQAVAQSRQSFVGRLIDALAAAGEGPADQTLLAVGHGIVHMSRAEADVAQMLHGEAQYHPEVHALFRGLFEEVVDRIAQYLAGRVDAGELRRDLPTRVAAHGFVSALLMFFILHQHEDLDEWRRITPPFVRDWVDAWYRGAKR